MILDAPLLRLMLLPATKLTLPVEPLRVKFDAFTDAVMTPLVLIPKETRLELANENAELFTLVEPADMSIADIVAAVEGTALAVNAKAFWYANAVFNRATSAPASWIGMPTHSE